MPSHLSIVLFRVLQGALHNAVKHSEAKHFEVQVRADLGEIYLVVSDPGKGLHVNSAMTGPGLGLTSMQERSSTVEGSDIDYVETDGTERLLRFACLSGLKTFLNAWSANRTGLVPERRSVVNESLTRS
jgi:glucose-6-phosphate-specific signal transduction histidine kinase